MTLTPQIDCQHWELSFGIYELQEQAVVDTANNQITLEVDHFSTYVLVNTTTWFNPVRPNYDGYFYYPNVIVQADDVQGSYTLQTYEDIAWADFQAEHGENFVRVNTVYSYDYHMNGNYYYLYEWLAIDTTDSDEDGALDFMETLGVLGSNHHTYYSDVGNPDSDGDTLPDGVELGNIYLLGKFTDNNYLEKYRMDVDGTITPCQDFHKFDFFRSILFSRSVAAVACIHSDPMMQDSDGDLDCDLIDPHPTRRLLNDRLIYNISLLEEMASNYLGNDEIDSSELVFCFIRSFNDKYTDLTWAGTGGAINPNYNIFVYNENPDLYAYFQSQQHYYTDYNYGYGDLYHFAATLSGLIHNSTYNSGSDFWSGMKFQFMSENIIDDLSGWAGDFQQLVRDDIDPRYADYSCYSDMYDLAYSLFFEEGASFSLLDLNSDVDAVNIYALNNEDDCFSDTMATYYMDMMNCRLSLFDSNARLESIVYYSREYYQFSYYETRWPLFENDAGESLVTHIDAIYWNAIQEAFLDKLDYLIGLEQE